MKRLLTAAATLALMGVACSSDGAGTTTTTEPVATTTTTTAATTSTSSTTTTTTPDTTTTSSAVRDPIPDDQLPGDVWTDWIFPDIPKAVVGVEHDDVLNVRAGPGVSYDVVGTYSPMEETVLQTGRARIFPGSLWVEVSLPDGPGWVNDYFLGYKGPTDDLTSLVVDRLGKIPTAAQMEDLGLMVAQALASEEPPSAITLTVPATVGDLGEVTYDLVGLGDDATWAMRLHVFGQKADGSGFSLMSVEATFYCLRGLTPEGLCP